jgi:protein-S-isoprenylcysteine O-methyltransferase Ste14
VVRHPRYVGLAVIGLGTLLIWPRFLAALTYVVLIHTLPLVIILRYGVDVREEAYLERRFGDAYRDYQARVRRWL